MKLQEDDLNIYKVFKRLKLTDSDYQIRFGLNKVPALRWNAVEHR